jgi:O-antigen/teichoic acid export membrane protein
MLRGIAWNTCDQIFQAALPLGGMLVLVRVISPAKYGRAGAVLGFLTLLNTFNCANFMVHASQLPDGAEPDWSLHWSAGLYIQIALTGTCHLLAGFYWLFTAYRPIAPLLHLAALGLLIDSANRLGYTMLQCAVDFQRLRIVHGLGTLASVTVTLALGLAGSGAYAIVLGSNVVAALPFSIDLFVVRCWRPRVGWWRWPD